MDETPDDFDDFDAIDRYVNELCTPEYLELTLAWILMRVQLQPEVELGNHRFD